MDIDKHSETVLMITCLMRVTTTLSEVIMLSELFTDVRPMLAEMDEVDARSVLRQMYKDIAPELADDPSALRKYINSSIETFGKTLALLDALGPVLVKAIKENKQLCTDFRTLLTQTEQPVSTAPSVSVPEPTECFPGPITSNVN